MKTLKEKQLDFLNETIEHYKTNPRGMKKGSYCSYEHGCAIGRHLNKELAIQLDKLIDIGQNSGVSYSNVFNILPEFLKELKIDFLTRVQKLHDNSLFWTKNDSEFGFDLSESGESEVNSIKTSINIEYPL